MLFARVRFFKTVQWAVFGKSNTSILIVLFCFIFSNNHAQSNCPTDLDQDNVTNTADFIIFGGGFAKGPCDPELPCPTDYNGDNITNTVDFMEFGSGFAKGKCETEIITKSIDGTLRYNISIPGHPVVYNVAAGGSYAYTFVYPDTTVTIEVPASSTNKALTYQFRENLGRISNVQTLVDGEFRPLSPHLYDNTYKNRLIFYRNDAAAEPSDNTKRINVTLGLKNGMILTPNLPQNNKLKFESLQSPINTQLLVYDKSNNIVYEATNVYTKDPWDGKINSVVIPGLYKYELTINSNKLTGQFLVSDEQ